jgi:hypothetical protein
MNALPPAPAIPGTRIGGYRNSLPRRIRLLGLGTHGSNVAREVGARNYPNVEVMTEARPLGWDEIVKECCGEPANMIVVVCGHGDERLFSPAQGRPAALVTFVLLIEGGNASVGDDRHLAKMRGQSDLFVTTSDNDYVGELIDNLAS